MRKHILFGVVCIIMSAVIYTNAEGLLSLVSRGLGFEPPTAQGANNQVLQSDGAGGSRWLTGTAVGDSLGSHVATKTLDMAGFIIDNTGDVSMEGSVTIKVNDITKDFSIDSTSATFYDALNVKGAVNVTGLTTVGNINAVNVKSLDDGGIGLGDGIDYQWYYSSALDNLRLLANNQADTLMTFAKTGEITISTDTTIKVNGSNKDFSIDSSSATFYDNLNIKDDKEVVFGTGQDFSVGYDSGADELRGVRGADITADAAVGWRVTRSTVVAIGDAGSMGANMNGSGDLYVEDDLEVGDRLNVTGVATFAGRVVCQDLFALTSKSEAELKAITPTGSGQLYYDNTNFQVVVSTAAVIASFGTVADGTVLPTGW